MTDTAIWKFERAHHHASNVYIAARYHWLSIERFSLGNHRYGSDNFFTGGTPVTLAPLTVINGIGNTTTRRQGAMGNLTPG